MIIGLTGGIGSGKSAAAEFFIDLGMMVGAMKTIQIAASVVLGLLLGPIFYFLSPEWSILLGGLVGGTIAYLIGELNVN